jgi:hypothetical protein
MFGWPKRKLGNEVVAQILEDFLEGRGNPLAWDGFTLGRSIDNPQLEEIRLRCAGLSQEFPSDSPSEYCNEQGREVIRGYIKQLRKSP